MPCFVANSKLRGSDSSGNLNGNPGNAGNVKKGKEKKDAGKRSGLSRSAKKAFVVKEPWLVFILASQKTW